mmetsp:Transcript_49599/g.102329  ORF Transcript_49599/g.102329 Transcript_49599/m.102329 type:complete len:92 (-) Transcript_49599:521-796(-)
MRTLQHEAKTKSTCPDVYTFIPQATQQQFRCCKVLRATIAEHCGTALALADDLRAVEVSEFQSSCPICQEAIVWFDVSMNDSSLVQEVDSS